MPRLNPLATLLLVAVVSLAVLCWLLPSNSSTNNTSADEIVVYCAAAMRAPIEEIAEAYEQEYAASITIQYGGSNTLLSQIEVARQGDLFLAADRSYLELALDRKIVREILPLAAMRAVVVVPKGNPKKIETLDDLMKWKVAAANPDQAAIGRETRRLFTVSGRWGEFDKQVRERGVYKPTVGEVANDVKLGSVDAGIVWDAVAAQHPEIETVEIAELVESRAEIALGVLTDSKQPTAALRFARFVAARDRGLAVFEKLGYETVEGDPWQPRPQFTFYAGAVNRKALEPIVARFAEREGVEVNTVYNGCGILNAQLEGLGTQHELFPDAYMPCDVYYRDAVDALFDEGVQVSNTRIVIVVAKGNPKNISSLADLHKRGVRVSLGQPQQCTIGVLSRKLLESEGLYEQVLADNVVAQTTSSSLLIPSIVTKSADATLAYACDAQAEGDKLTLIPIDSPLAQAVQPFSISRTTKYRQLAQRLGDQIMLSRPLFEAAGFGWQSPDN